MLHAVGRVGQRRGLAGEQPLLVTGGELGVPVVPGLGEVSRGGGDLALALGVTVRPAAVLETVERGLVWGSYSLILGPLVARGQ